MKKEGEQKLQSILESRENHFKGYRKVDRIAVIYIDSEHESLKKTKDLFVPPVPYQESISESKIESSVTKIHFIWEGTF